MAWREGVPAGWPWWAVSGRVQDAGGGDSPPGPGREGLTLDAGEGGLPIGQGCGYNTQRGSSKHTRSDGIAVDGLSMLEGPHAVAVEWVGTAGWRWC